jgi:hypothetical protein
MQEPEMNATRLKKKFASQPQMSVQNITRVRSLAMTISIASIHAWICMQSIYQFDD